MAKIINKIWNAVKGLPLDVKSRSVIAEALTKAETNEGSGGEGGSSAGFGDPVATAKAGNVGTDPAVTIEASGPNTAKVFTFEFTIPKGDKGDKGDAGNPGAPGANGKNAVMEIGTVTTGAAGTNASATVTANGTDASGNHKYALSLTIPRGDKGEKGDAGSGGGSNERSGRLLLWVGHDSTGDYRPSTSKVNLFPNMPTLVAGDLVLDSKGNYREVASVNDTKDIANMGDILITIPATEA